MEASLQGVKYTELAEQQPMHARPLLVKWNSQHLQQKLGVGPYAPGSSLMATRQLWHSSCTPIAQFACRPPWAGVTTPGAMRVEPANGSGAACPTSPAIPPASRLCTRRQRVTWIPRNAETPRQQIAIGRHLGTRTTQYNVEGILPADTNEFARGDLPASARKLHADGTEQAAAHQGLR